MSKIFHYIPAAYKVGLTYTAIPSNTLQEMLDASFTFSRPAPADRTDENSATESMAINVPRIDYSDEGCPKLLLDNSLTERCYQAYQLAINPNEMVWSVELSATSNSGTVRSVALTDLTNSIVSIGYTATDNQILFEFFNNGPSVSNITYNNCDVTLFRNLTVRKSNGIVDAKVDGVFVGTTDSVTDLPTMEEISYSVANVRDYMDGKTRENTIDNDVSTFNSTATSYAELDTQINNFTTR